MDKSTLRKEIRARKKSCSPEQLEKESVRIMRKLAEHPDFQRAEIVMLYASLPDEVQTLDFIEKWRTRKRIILPTVVGDDIMPVAAWLRVTLTSWNLRTILMRVSWILSWCRAWPSTAKVTDWAAAKGITTVS